MGDVLRHEVVQFSFEIDNGALGKISKEIDSLKGKFEGISGDEAFEKLKKNAEKTEQPLEKVSNKLSDSEKNAKKFSASLKSIDSKSLKNVDKKLTEITSKLGKGIVSAAKKASIAIAGMGTALGAIVKQSVSAFADREQLVGGVETLFKDSANIVQQYANDAYKTSGLSANDYMETVTGFSASLLQSLNGDTKKSAEIANMAIIDMSDNANKMGTSMESIQYAYQGFAKQNYTIETSSRAA